jgi:hypothetical protein
MKQIFIITVLLVFSLSKAEAIKHRFIVVDESRAQLHYVDQFDPSNDWDIHFSEHFRDVRLIKKQRILVGTINGYEEYDLKTQKKIKTFADPSFIKTETITRLSNGHTILGCNYKDKGGVKFFEFDKKDRLVRSVSFPTLRHMRIMRTMEDGSFLFGGHNEVVKADWNGVIKKFAISDKTNRIYEVDELANGNYCVSTGFGASLEEWTPEGTFVRKIAGGKPAPKGCCYNFFCGMQLLSNNYEPSYFFLNNKAIPLE